MCDPAPIKSPPPHKNKKFLHAVTFWALGFSSIGECVLLLCQGHYDKDTQSKQNKAINKRNIVFHFTSSSVLWVNYVIEFGRKSSVKKCCGMLKPLPTQYVYKSFCWVFGSLFFGDILLKQPEKFWNRLNLFIDN